MTEDYNFIRSFKINGKDTKHLFQIAQINIPFLSKDNEYFTVGNTNGKHFRGSRLGDYSISIDGFIIKDNSKMTVSNTKDELVKLVNSKEPQMLEFDILPDRYFMGVYSGVHEYDGTNVDYTPLTLVFDVPEAFARQIVTNNYSNTTSTGNLFIDSEFTHKLTYTQPYIQKEVEKYNGSTVLSLNTDAFGNASIESQLATNNQVNYFNDVTTIVERPKSLNAVTISIASHTTKLNDLGDKQGVLIFKEYGVNNKELLKTTTLDINSTDTTGFKTYTKKGIPLDSRTTSFSLQYAQVGRGVTKISQPYLGISSYSYTYTKSNMISSIEPIEVYNGGTHETYPKINVTMKSDNALIAFKNEKDNILQFGTPSAEDYIEKTKLETTEHFTFYGNVLASNWNVNADFPYYYRNYLWDSGKPNLITGTWDVTSNPHNIKPKFNNTADKVWQGPTATTTITSNSVNDRTMPFTANIIFWFAHSNNTNGRMEYLFYDELNKPVMGVVFTDENGLNGNYINMSCMYQGKVVYKYKMLKKDFRRGNKEINIQRLKDTVVWRIVSPKSLSGNHLDKVEVGFQKVFTLNVENKQKISKLGLLMWNFPSVKPTVMAIDDIKLRWNDTPYIQDVKNIFQKGDVVEVDVATRKLFVNGVENGLLNLRGNEWEAFKLSLGKSKIAPIFSDFATQPVVNIEVQNRYL